MNQNRFQFNVLKSINLYEKNLSFLSFLIAKNLLFRAIMHEYELKSYYTKNTNAQRS